jgi:hypothetical protein
MAAINVAFNGTAQDLADFCAAMEYQATLIDPNGQPFPNPETQAQFFSRIVKSYAGQVVTGYRARRDAEVARVAALAAPPPAF